MLPHYEARVRSSRATVPRVQGHLLHPTIDAAGATVSHHSSLTSELCVILTNCGTSPQDLMRLHDLVLHLVPTPKQVLFLQHTHHSLLTTIIATDTDYCGSLPQLQQFNNNQHHSGQRPTPPALRGTLTHRFLTPTTQD